MAESFRSIPTPSALGGAVGAWDEMTDPRGQVRPHWQSIGVKFQRWGTEQRTAMLESARRMLSDLGTTFNVYSDAGGAGQPYELDPLPLMIPAAEWAAVSAGLAQRMKLIDAVLADLYGPRQLLREGLIPPDLVSSNPAFFQYTRGASPVGGRFLVTSGCDLIRTANGNWTVLRDHTDVPGGLGQVLENRNVVSNLLSDEFEELRIARLGEFFDLEKSTLESLMPTRDEIPNVVLLTPGFRHPSYFEHAYKARLLGFPLVEPADLTVRERRLFVKTLAGLRRIDGVACRIEGEILDPLEQWGTGGIPGIVEAWRTGNVALANAPGSGFASSPALMPFLPGICRRWFGEDLKLPFVETWWLSQENVRKRVLDQLHRYVLISAFNREPLLPLRCSTLSAVARRNWASMIEERPYDFVAQLDAEPSTVPALQARGIRQRPLVWRTFAVNGAEGPVVLPGGFARVGKPGQSPQLWPGHAGFTKDVWVADGATIPGEKRISDAMKRGNPAALEVPSRIAEQLFWVGRYAERIELATRLLRVTLRNLGGETGKLQHEQLAACLALIRGSQLLPKETTISPALAFRVISGLIQDQTSRSGIPYLTRSLMMNAAAARDRLSDDTWRFFNRLEAVVHEPPESTSISGLLRTLDSLILNLSAIAGLAAENMTRGHGWRFLEVGRRIERGIGCLGLLQSACGQTAAKATLLGPLLEICDSVMTYRRRNFSKPQLEPVYHLLFSDLSNPRSVAYQLAIIDKEFRDFPGNPEIGLMPAIRLQLDSLVAMSKAQPLLSAMQLQEFVAAVAKFADMLTQNYFSHSQRRIY